MCTGTDPPSPTDPKSDQFKKSQTSEFDVLVLIPASSYSQSRFSLEHSEKKKE